MIQRNSMIPNYSMIPAIRWSPAIQWSPAIWWSTGSTDFDNPKVYDDTSITDGLVWRTICHHPRCHVHICVAAPFFCLNFGLGVFFLAKTVSVSSFSSKLTTIMFDSSNPGWGYGAFGWIAGSRVSVIEKPSSPLPFRSPCLCRHFPLQVQPHSRRLAFGRSGKFLLDQHPNDSKIAFSSPLWWGTICFPSESPDVPKESGSRNHFVGGHRSPL